MHGENFMPSAVLDESVAPVDMLEDIKRANGNNTTAKRDSETDSWIISVKRRSAPFSRSRLRSASMIKRNPMLNAIQRLATRIEHSR